MPVVRSQALGRLFRRRQLRLCRAQPRKTKLKALRKGRPGAGPSSFNLMSEGRGQGLSRAANLPKRNFLLTDL